jgi:hypothetical protein
MPRTVPSQIVDFINQNIPDRNSTVLAVNHTTVGALVAVTRLIDEVPAELLTISGEDYSNLVTGVESIRNSVAFWHRQGIAQVGNQGIKGKNTLLVIRDVLAKCDDQTPSPATPDLPFVTDAALRDSIRLDISTATSALHNGEWKAATVLAGAAAEALLLWTIQGDPNHATLAISPKKPADEWRFVDLIAVATALKLITSNTSQQANLARDFRNLIHPGRAQRLGEVCDRATALTALAAVEHIVRDLR